MKEFIKMTLAVILGLIIMGFVGMMILSGIAGSFAGNSASAPLPKSGILKIDLSKTIVMEQEQPGDPLTMLQSGETIDIVGILDAVNAINVAAVDPAIKCIYLKADGNMTSLATLQEMRIALDHFRMSGKPVVSYTESPTTGSYYISSVADKVWITAHPGANMSVNGISLQMTFLRDLLDRLGVNVQLIRHGKYKSAGEMFVRNSPSPENLEQYEALVSSMWGSLSTDIAASRGISTERLNEAIDGLELCLSEDFVKAGLADEMITREQLKERLTTLAQVADFKDVKMVSLKNYAVAKRAPILGRKNEIAVIFADGDIVDGNDIQNVAGDRFASVISKVRADSTVKAVVLRVNSPGGSVIASEKIKAELDLLKARKPLIASYGGYAASGGYWISGCCDKIFSDAVTLTGSIGVFGMIPDFSKTAKDIAHVGITSVNSHKHSDMYSLMRPFDSAEYGYMLRSIEDIYTRFVSIVAGGRSLTADYVDSIGQGRVWTGADALGKGLVDEIGTLEDALRYAAAAAGNADVSTWRVMEYPKPQTTMEMLMSSLGQAPLEDESIFAGTALAPVAGSLLNWYERIKDGRNDYVFARLPLAIEIK